MTSLTIAQHNGLTDQICQFLLPGRTDRTWDWISKNIRTKDGDPFNPFDYPWGEGIADAWDDPDIRTIWLQTCARIGKTTLASALMISAIERDPRPGMVGQPTETLLKEQVKDKYYPMLLKCPATKAWVPPPHYRKQHRVDLSTTVIYGAWSGSGSALSDKDPTYKHGGEIDKWTSEKSDEADPLFLFLERGIEIPDRKVVLESTPAIAGRSRINRGLENGTNCRYHVPCPHCGTYQHLILGDGTGAGIIWDKDEDGVSDAGLAHRTARYRCEKCSKEIHDDQRRSMMLKGVWVPQGCRAARNRRLMGTPVNQGADASFQISRLYSPTFSFGDIAKEFILSGDDLGRYRNFRNSWMGEVWHPHHVDEEWDVIGRRMSGTHSLAGIPDEASFITVGVDVQVDHWVYTTVAWGSEARGWLIDYGTVPSWDELKKVLRREYGGLIPMFSLVDARDGNRTDEVVEFCRSVNKQTGPWVWPSMGTASTVMSQKPFIRQKLTADNQTQRSRRKALADVEVIKVSTNYYQVWIQNCIERRTPGTPNSLALCVEAGQDQDFIEQLLNEQVDVSEDTTGHDKLKWVKVSRHIPIDFRDSLRYARCAADVYLNTNWQRIPAKRAVVKPEGDRKEDRPAPSKKQPATEKQATKRSNWLNRERIGAKFLRGR